MCELLAMSARLPTDISFSLTGFTKRGGETGPHRDGFGICFYDQGGVREFKDHLPSVDSAIAGFLKNYPIRSQIVIAHIRQANVGQVCLSNTHPFQRELWGRAWTFAHNGQIALEELPEPSHYQPIGSTDSERIFCWLLSELREECVEICSSVQLAKRLAELCQQLNRKGVTNILLSDGRDLFVFCSTKLSWITRQAPFGEAHLCDEDITIDFSAVTTEEDVVTVIATQPLTDNEQWQTMKSGEARLFQDGISIWSELGEEVQHKKSSITEELAGNDN